jgi:hypothetical protein
MLYKLKDDNASHLIAEVEEVPLGSAPGVAIK